MLDVPRMQCELGELSREIIRATHYIFRAEDQILMNRHVGYFFTTTFRSSRHVEEDLQPTPTFLGCVLLFQWAIEHIESASGICL